MYFNYQAILEKFEKNKIWSFHIKIPNKIASELHKVGKRLVCTINEHTTFQCGMISAGKLGYFININSTIRKKAKISLHESISISLSSDTSKYGLPIPEVFLELLKQDPIFNKIFHELTPGKQRSLIHKIGTYKSEEKQLEKLIIIRNYLIQVKGKLDFKELYQAFKQNN